MPTSTFAFDFDPRFRGLLRVLGIRPESAVVTVDDEVFDACFGPWRLTTPVTNLCDVQVTRDYQWFRAIGPRGSAADGGFRTPEPGCACASTSRCRACCPPIGCAIPA